MENGVVTPVKAPVLSVKSHIPLTPLSEVETTSNEINLKKPKLTTFQLDTTKFCRGNGTYATSFCRQWYMLMIRSLLCLSRDRSLTAMRLVIHICIGLLIGTLYFGIGNDAAMIFNNFRFIFLSIMFLMFTSFSTTSITCKLLISFFFCFDAKCTIYLNKYKIQINWL